MFKTLQALVIAPFVCALVPTVSAKVVDIEMSSAGGTVLVTPAGNGESLDLVGARIDILVTSPYDGTPIAGYPWQDLMVRSENLNGCIYNGYALLTADQNTNAAGETSFTGVLAGGGWSLGITVEAGGWPNEDTVPVNVVSPDLNGDLVVNLADLGDFAIDYINGIYDFRSDLNHDGVESLADVAIMVEHSGESCR